MSSLVRDTKKRRRKEKIRRILTRSTWALALALALSGIFFLPHLRVQTVTVSGASDALAKKLTDVVRDRIGGRRWFVYPADSILLVHTGDLTNTLLATYPQLSFVSVRRESPHSIAVAVRERGITALWCAQLGGETAPCFYVDETGTAFDTAPDVSGDLIATIIDTKAATPRLGDIAVSKQILELARVFSADLESRTGVRARAIELNREYPGSVDVDTVGGWQIRLEAQTNAREALENLKLVLDRKISKRESLEYVDVRFANKVFYKLK